MKTDNSDNYYSPTADEIDDEWLRMAKESSKSWSKENPYNEATE